MSIGPVEYIAIAFPGNKFSGRDHPGHPGAPGLGTIRVLDLIIITKDSAGDITAIELSEAGPELQATLGVLGVETQEPARPGGRRGHRRRPRSEQHRGADDLGERLGGPLRAVAPERRRHPRRERPHPGRPRRGADGRRRFLIDRATTTERKERPT